MYEESVRRVTFSKHPFSGASPIVARSHLLQAARTLRVAIADGDEEELWCGRLEVRIAIGREVLL